MDNPFPPPPDQQYRSLDGPGARPVSMDGVIRPEHPVETLEAVETETLDPIAQGAIRPMEPEMMIVYKRQSWKGVLTLAGFGLLIVLMIAGAIFVAVTRGRRAAPVQTGTFSNVRLPLGQIARPPSAASSGSSVRVGGQLVVSDSVVFGQSIEPDEPVQGQMYYDKDTNELRFYNGDEFINLGASVQTNTNVTNLIDNSSTTIGTGGGSSVTASGGRAGAVPKFTGATGLTPSIITDNGTSVSVTGNLNLVAPSTAAQAELQLWPESPVPTNPTSPDIQSVEVGVKIRTDVSGFIKGVRFYKGATNTGTHVGHLWSSSGVSLATATFTNETATGWQEVRFAAPVPIAAETTYVASYHTTVGRYAFDANYFSTGGRSNGALHAPRDGEDGANGVYSYSATPAFPTNGFNGSNYWVDVIFQPNPPPPQYQVNGVPISSADLSNNSDLAKRSASQLFTGNNTFRSSAASVAAFSIQSANGLTLLQADTASDRLYVGPVTGSEGGVILVLGNRIVGGDPIGVEGAIYYNRDRHIFRCYRYGAWGACADPEVETIFSQYDEFMGGGTTSGNVGSLGWNAVAIGANGPISLNPSTPTPLADRPGVVALQTPAVANQGTTFMLGDASNPSMIIQASHTVKTAVAMGAATGQVVRIGVHNQTNTTAQPVSGIWWEANPAVDSHWRYCYGDGTVATCVASSVNITANAWVRLEMRVHTTGTGTSMLEFGNGSLYYTVQTGTIDVANRVSPAFSCYTTVATAQNCYWDYFQIKGGTSAER